MGILIILVMAILMVALQVVPEGSVYTVTRAGRLHRVLSSGPHFIWPLYEKIATRVSLRTRCMETPLHSAYSQDGRKISVSLIVVYRIVDPEIVSFCVEDLKRNMVLLVYASLNRVLGLFAADQVLQSRVVMLDLMEESLQQSFERIGVRVVEIDIKNVEFYKSSRPDLTNPGLVSLAEQGVKRV